MSESLHIGYWIPAGGAPSVYAGALAVDGSIGQRLFGQVKSRNERIVSLVSLIKLVDGLCGPPTQMSVFIESEYAVECVNSVAPMWGRRWSINTPCVKLPYLEIAQRLSELTLRHIIRAVHVPPTTTRTMCMNLREAARERSERWDG